MKIVIPGGTGQVGSLLVGHLQRAGHDVVVLSRGGRSEARVVAWDGETLGDWAQVVSGADVVINLAGRSVNCRYTEQNLRDMMASRVRSTRVVGAAIARADRPPRVWLQMSTATIYAHRFDANNDEATGSIGGNEPDAPAYWRRSIEIAQAWEKTQMDADTPHTRRIAMRTAMVMSPDRGGVFDVLSRLAAFGLGGASAGGQQFVSWIHDVDFVRAVDWLIRHDEIDGAVNIAAPQPLPQRDFMRDLRQAMHVPIGLPATKWMLELGAFALRTDTELLLKSRRVFPSRLLDSGFDFAFPHWADAVRNLVERRGL